MLTIRIDGASVNEIQRGLLAAQAVFDRAGILAMDAAEARFEEEGWDARGLTDPTTASPADSGLWDAADRAAVAACCMGWLTDRVPSSARLELIYAPEPDEEDDEDELAELERLRAIDPEGVARAEATMMELRRKRA